MTADPSLADRLDALLPQTQCTRCGYDGCRPYAEAMGNGAALPNRCPPGGTPVLEALAVLLEVPVQPLDPACGAVGPPQVAIIDEMTCIGCAKCIEACPTDAIIGARKWMHTVIRDDCSGCELCIPPCPVDCIAMVASPGLPARPLDGASIAARAAHYRGLYDSRLARRARDAAEWRQALDTRFSGGTAGTSA